MTRNGLGISQTTSVSIDLTSCLFNLIWFPFNGRVQMLLLAVFAPFATKIGGLPPEKKDIQTAPVAPGFSASLGYQVSGAGVGRRGALSIRAPKCILPWDLYCPLSFPTNQLVSTSFCSG